MLPSTSSAKKPSISEDVLPPPALIQDEPNAADAARQRLTPPSRLARILLFPKSRSRSKSSLVTGPKRNIDSASETRPSNDTQEPSATKTASSTLDHAPIILNDTATKEEDDETKDKYEWAVVYENQRGMTIFSIPYYSALSLLPTDPSAFTLPNASHRRSEQPPITLETYPLPDGSWRWVSRAWMIDMRSGTTTVQHDGFEYNWMFRRHNWRAEIGFLSAGGWVRRRRWVRLMVRPGKVKAHSDSGSTSSSTSSTHNLLRQSMASSNLSSVSSLLHSTVETVWQGNEDDWKRCRSLMLRYARDGRKIDLWKIWLGHYHPAYENLFAESDNSGKGKQRQKQWTEDDGLLPSQSLEPDAASHRSMIPPPREYIAPVLRKRGHDLLQLFVFPDSRVQLLKLLGKAGFLPDIGVGIGSNFSTSEVEFWSYMNGLAEELKPLNIRNIFSIPDTTSSSFLRQLE